MKLRIKGNSLRLRVGPSELPRLLQTGRIEETIRFGRQPDAKWTYALEHSATEPALSVRYQPGEVAVVLSTESVVNWAGSSQVGINGAVEVAHGQLTLLVEKDFACLDPAVQHDEDTFPNPLSGGSC